MFLSTGLLTESGHLHVSPLDITGQHLSPNPVASQFPHLDNEDNYSLTTYCRYEDELREGT